MEVDGFRLLLDCGLKQGPRKKTFEENRNLPFDPASVDAVVLSHAHIDHSGNLPTLVKRGFSGKIFATKATADLCDIMLRDSAHIQEQDVKFVNKKRLRQGKTPFEPLYTAADIDPVMERFHRVFYGEEVDVGGGVSLTFYDAGHILGSAFVVLGLPDGRRLFFTGDMGRSTLPILRDPVVVDEFDILLTESTYGDRVHPHEEDVKGRLKAFIEDICNLGSRLVVPAFSVGRTQQLVYMLHELYRKGRIPGVPVYVDSPLSTRATEVYERHPECYDKETYEMFFGGDDPFQFKTLHYITDVEESMRLNEMPGPVVIISASGMCEAGRILHHLAHSIGDPRNILLFVGYQAEHTLGRYIIERRSPVKIFGEKYDVYARVHTINALSAHADREEMLDYFTSTRTVPSRTFVVHGEEEQSLAFAAALEGRGFPDVSVPHKGQKVEL